MDEMKNILCFFLLTVTSAIGQAPTIAWQKTFGGYGLDQCYASQQTADGGYIMVGTAGVTNGDVGFLFGSQDFWVVKLNGVGAVEWKENYGGTGVDYAYGIKQAVDGGYIIVGQSSSTDYDAIGNHGSYDGLVIKINSLGVIEWNKILGGVGYDRFYSVDQTIDGGYVVAGHTNSNNGTVTGNHGLNDAWVVKFDNLGNILWQKLLGGNQGEYAFAINKTLDGGCVVGCSTQSNNGDVSGNHGNDDAWIVKLDGSGTISWQKAFGGSGTEKAYAVQQASDGGYILAGNSNSVNGEVSGNHGDYDFWIVKFTSSGVLEWQKSLGGTGYDSAKSIRQTSDGDYIISGETNSNNDGDVTGFHWDNDFWVVKLSSTGNLLWQKALGGFGQDYPYSVTQTTDGGYFVAGYTGSSDGDVTVYHGDWDFWCAKLSPDQLTVNDFKRQDITIYPNPASTKLNFYITTGIIDKITISDLTGKHVLEQLGGDSIDTSILQTGIYMLQAYISNKLITKKFIKE
jgi:hypothetical protein